MISMLLAITPHINWATFIHFKMKMIVQGWGSTMTEHAQKFGRYSFFFFTVSVVGVFRLFSCFGTIFNGEPI